MKMASRLINLITKKSNCTCSTLFLLISKKQICTWARFFVFPLPLFCTTTTPFCTTKTSNVLVTHYFYGGIVVLTQYFFIPVFTFAFIFHCRSFSPCSPLAALNFHVFLPTKFVSFVFKTRSSSFSIIHVSGNIKNNAEKETTLLLFFLSKSPGGHVISFQIKPGVVCGLPYLMIELFYVGMPVVRTDGRSLGVRSRDYQHFFSYGAPPTRGASRRAWSSTKNTIKRDSSFECLSTTED